MRAEGTWASPGRGSYLTLRQNAGSWVRVSRWRQKVPSVGFKEYLLRVSACQPSILLGTGDRAVNSCIAIFLGQEGLLGLGRAQVSIG